MKRTVGTVELAAREARHASSWSRRTATTTRSYRSSGARRSVTSTRHSERLRSTTSSRTRPWRRMSSRRVPRARTVTELPPCLSLLA